MPVETVFGCGGVKAAAVPIATSRGRRDVDNFIVIIVNG
jgi:hypothetical protein